MLIKRKSYFISFILIYLLTSEVCQSQIFNITFNNLASLDISNADDIIYDVNREICSIVRINTESDSVKFYSNLGVEKILKTDYGYKIWIPNQAKTLKFSVPGLALNEYKLPDSDFKYSVFTITINPGQRVKIIVKDTIQPSLSISTTPSGASVYILGYYFGKSPVIIDKPGFKVFDYSIAKKGYTRINSKDSIDHKQKNITVTLKDEFKSRRYYFSVNMKVDKPQEPRVKLDFRSMLGITFGALGKTGYYGSFDYVDFEKDYPINYYDLPNYNKVQKFNFEAGINQQLGRSLFVFGGPGYLIRRYQEDDNPVYKSQSINLKAGLMIRIAWNCNLQFDYTKSLNNSYSILGFGFGFNFSAKKQINR